MGGTLPDRLDRLPSIVDRGGALQKISAGHWLLGALVRVDLVNEGDAAEFQSIGQWKRLLPPVRIVPSGSGSRVAGLLMQPQHRHSLDFAGLLSGRSATWAVTASTT
jgi:hypothetical protein